MFSHDDRFRARCLDVGAAIILALWGGFIGLGLFASEVWRWQACLPVLGSTVMWVFMFELFQMSSLPPGITFAERLHHKARSLRAEPVRIDPT